MTCLIFEINCVENTEKFYFGISHIIIQNYKLYKQN